MSVESKRILYIWLRPVCWIVGHDIDIPNYDKKWYYCHRCWYPGAYIDQMYSSVNKGKE